MFMQRERERDTENRSEAREGGVVTCVVRSNCVGLCPSVEEGYVCMYVFMYVCMMNYTLFTPTLARLK